MNLSSQISSTARSMFSSPLAVAVLFGVLIIAVKTALALGLNPRAVAVAVTYAASCWFLTPLEPACVLIYTPGRYRFLDFIKVGSILTIAVFAIVILLVPYFWPLT